MNQEDLGMQFANAFVCFWFNNLNFIFSKANASEKLQTITEKFHLSSFLPSGEIFTFHSGL